MNTKLIHLTIGGKSPSELEQELRNNGIGFDPIALALWRQMTHVPKEPRDVNLKTMLTTAPQNYGAGIKALESWRTEFCPPDIIATLVLQRHKWLDGKRVVIGMEPLRFPEIMNECYAYVLCIEGGKISVINVADDPLLTGGTTLGIVQRI